VVQYDDHYPWPREPDGDGPSLELRDPASDNSLAASWRPSEGTGGTPGTGSATGIKAMSPPAFDHGSIHIWPNPFSTAACIEYSFPEEGRITARIFNAQGREVDLISGELCPPGMHVLYWEPEDLPAGLYVINVSNGKSCQSVKVLYLDH
jgi:hypothetical protein